MQRRKRRPTAQSTRTRCALMPCDHTSTRGIPASEGKHANCSSDHAQMFPKVLVCHLAHDSTYVHNAPCYESRIIALHESCMLPDHT